MSASLVGSEMCIRDRHSPPCGLAALFGMEAGCTRIDSAALAVCHTLPCSRRDHAIRPTAP
eukprot:8238171-Alexandrium_andersonii.AAC.1